MNLGIYWANCHELGNLVHLMRLQMCCAEILKILIFWPVALCEAPPGGVSNHAITQLFFRFHAITQLFFHFHAITQLFFSFSRNHAKKFWFSRKIFFWYLFWPKVESMYNVRQMSSMEKLACARLRQFAKIQVLSAPTCGSQNIFSQ